MGCFMQLSLFDKHVLEGVHLTGSTAGCYGHVAKRQGLTLLDMQEKVFRGEALVGKWQHRIRQVQQLLKRNGLIEPVSRGSWAVTQKGRLELNVASRHAVKLYFVTKSGLAFWGSSEHIGSMFPGEIDLIITSPPYLLTKEREYVNIGDDEASYVDGLVTAIESWLPCLTSTASIVLNLGDSTKKGAGHQSLYKERLLIALEDRLGLHLVQKFVWYSPSKMPSGYWVTHAKRDCVNATEDFYWLSLSPKTCKANNQSVLVEYSEKQREYIEAARRKSPVKKTRPSGQNASDLSFYADNGGAIPSNLLLATPEGAKSAYSRFCKDNGLPRHPAMFDHALPEFFIRFLTDRGDVVCDTYSGSGNTAYAAEINNREWISFDVVREYVAGHYGRFVSNGIEAELVV